MVTPEKNLKFEHPPISEIALSVHFEQLNGLLSPHLGVIWEEFKNDQFMQIIEQPPVQPIIEKFPNLPGGEARLNVSNIPVLPRIWFIENSNNRILQVQRDRFTFNWRKIDSEQQYPGFSSIFEEFEGFYNRFCHTLTSLGVGSVKPLQYELTYIDQLIEGVGWHTLDDLEQIYNIFLGSQESSSFWSGVEFMNLRTSFPVQDLHGRLHFGIISGMNHPEQKRMLQTDFIARGFPENAEYPMGAWFNLAHDQILDKFFSVFTEDIQTRIWGRKL